MAWTETQKLRHNLVPLNLAVDLVRAKLRDLRPGYDNNRDSIATFIGAVISVYEYFDTSGKAPRLIPNPGREGVFRHGGSELHFINGRIPIKNIAIDVEDVQCVVDMLAYPERAHLIRSKTLIAASGRLLRRNRILLARTHELRTTLGSFQSKSAQPRERPPATTTRDVTDDWQEC